MAAEGRKGESQRRRGSGDRDLSNRAASGANNPSEHGESGGKEGGSAQTPPGILTVEYINESESMDGTLKGLQERTDGLERLLTSLEEGHSELITAFNQQSKELQKLVSSVGRRIARIQETLVSVLGEAGEAVGAEVSAVPESVEEGVPERFADDPSHQEAWRTARILAAELEAFYPNEVKDGVINGNLRELLGRQLEEARKIYEQGVPEATAQVYDYFSAAIEALIARKKRELEG